MPPFDLLHLSDNVLEKILLNLSYDEIARLRIICKRFDSLCKKLLNKGFIAAERFHTESIKAVKTQLPRRESERRLHPMARHSDILSAVETRLSMLSMTFMKFINADLCCFIPGKVIDEIFRVLKYLKNCKKPPQAYEILRELRDISSMAMEHFDEKIAPGLKICCSSKSFAPNAYASQCSDSTSSCAIFTQPYFTHEKLRLEFLRSQLRDQKSKMELKALRNRVSRHRRMLKNQTKKLASQAACISKQDSQITEMKCTLSEWDHKYEDLAAKLSRVCEENAVLAAAIGVVFNCNKSAQEDPLVQPCTSSDCKEGKRKLKNECRMSPQVPKKSKLEDVPSEENTCAKDPAVIISDSVPTQEWENIAVSCETSEKMLCSTKLGFIVKNTSDIS